MEQIISFGTLGDQITEGFYDGEIGIVKAGRIGTDKTFEKEVLKNVAKGKSRETVKESIKHVNDEYSAKTKKASKESIDRFDKIDEAFEDEFEISLTNLFHLIDALTVISTTNMEPFQKHEKQDLINDKRIQFEKYKVMTDLINQVQKEQDKNLNPEDEEERIKVFRNLLNSKDVGIVVVDSTVLASLPDRLRMQLSGSVSPTVLGIGTEEDNTLRETIRRAIGVDLWK